MKSQTLRERIDELLQSGSHASQLEDAVRAASLDEVAETLNEAIDEKNDMVAHWLIVGGFERPSVELVPLLCRVIENGTSVGNVEDAIELLGDIGDERAVPALAKVVQSPPSGDVNDFCGAKAVHALASIATPQAIRAMLAAATSPRARARTWQAGIRHVLDHGDQNDLISILNRLVNEDPDSFYLKEVLPAIARLGTEKARAALRFAAVRAGPEPSKLAQKLLAEHDGIVP